MSKQIGQTFKSKIEGKSDVQIIALTPKRIKFVFLYKDGSRSSPWTLGEKEFDTFYPEPTA